MAFNYGTVWPVYQVTCQCTCTYILAVSVNSEKDFDIAHMRFLMCECV